MFNKYYFFFKKWIFQDLVVSCLCKKKKTTNLLFCCPTASFESLSKIIFDAKVTGSLVTRLSHLARPSTKRGLSREP